MKKIIKKVFILALICIIGCKGNVPKETTTDSVAFDSTTGTIDEAATTTGKVVDNTEQASDNIKAEIPLEKRGNAQALFRVGAEDAERLNVSKTLVWVTTGYEGCILGAKGVVSRFNDLLVNKYGCDFVVEFQVYSSFEVELVEDEYGDTHWAQRTYMHDDIVLDMMELGQQADVVDSGTWGGLDRLIEEGVYVPITDYLETAEGQKLYAAYSDTVWNQATRAGEIYGYTAKEEASDWYVIACNSNMAGELGIELKEGYSFYDLGNILSTTDIPEGEKISEKIFPIYVAAGNGLIYMEGYVPLNTGEINDNAIYYRRDENTDNWKAVNAAEEGGIIKLWKTIKEYKDKGWIYFKKNTFDTYVKKGDFLFIILKGNNAALVGNKLKYVNTVFDVVVGDKWYKPYVMVSGGVSGIASWSAYKEETCKLISLVNTEAELSRLLTYGIEGEHYAYENGVIIEYNESGGGSVRTSHPNLTIGNPNLLPSIGLEPDDKTEYYKEIGENFEASPELPYDIDISAFEEQLSSIGKIYNEYADKLNTGACEDIDATVAEMNKRLTEAGINDIVKEINRQLEEAQQ